MSADDAAPPGKPALRILLRERRRRFVASLGARRGAQETAIAAAAAPLLAGAGCVAVYAASGGEVDAEPLIALLVSRGAGIALPFSEARDAPPGFRRWLPGDPLGASPFGTRQPLATAQSVVPNAIVAPLLGFDRERHRLGAGAGWYDRALSGHPGAPAIGLAWSVQQLDPLPRDAWDVALDAIVTERGVA